MLLYHCSPATGVVAPCGSPHACPLSLSRAQHSPQREGARLAVAPSVPAPRVPATPFEQLLQAATASGFLKADSAQSELAAAQAALLPTREGVGFLLARLEGAGSGYRARAKTAGALAWALSVVGEREGRPALSVLREWAKRPVSPGSQALLVEALLSGSAPPASLLVGEAARLWLYQDSPHRKLAKALLFPLGEADFGYRPERPATVREVAHGGVLEDLGVLPEDLPEGVLAFDVETDTTRGFGLRPTRTQVTEVVASTRERSWVFSGDERELLALLAELLHGLPPETLLVGWNNWSFDNICLQTRAELHGVPSWGGRLRRASNATSFEPCGPSKFVQALEWRQASGGLLRDADAFQELAEWDRARGEKHTVGLKSFVEALGCKPRRVDRHRLHELSESERQAYVLSDGVSTLRALKEVRRLRGEC